MIWVDTIVQGVLLGGLYALFAAGLSLVFGIMRLVNLAHGDLIVLAAFLILVLVTALGLNPFIAALAASQMALSACGTLVGAGVGGLAGSTIGSGTGRTAATIGGAAAGAVVGHAVTGD